MNTAIELTLLCVAAGAVIRLVEASRRHLVGVRLERELRRAPR